MTLEETIALMLKNEESPAKIQEVKDAWEEKKKNKKKEEAGKTNDKAVGVFAESEKETPVMGPAEETGGNTDLELEDGSSELPEPSRQDNVSYNLPPVPTREEAVVLDRVSKIKDLTGLEPSEYPTVNTGDTEVTALNALKGLFSEQDPESTPVSKALDLDEMETLLADFSGTFHSMFDTMVSSEVGKLQNIQGDTLKHEADIKEIEDNAFELLSTKYPGLDKREFQSLAKVGSSTGLFQKALDDKVAKYNKLKSSANREGGANITDEEYDVTLGELYSNKSSQEKKKADIETQLREKRRLLRENPNDEVILGDIALLEDDKLKLATIKGTGPMGEYSGVIANAEDQLDPMLSGSYIDEDENLKYVNDKRAEAKKYAEATTPTQLSSIMNSNRSLSGFEAFELLLKGKVSEKKRLVAYGDTETIPLKGVHMMPKLYNELKALGLLDDESGNLVNIPISDLFDLGYDARDFEGMLNLQGRGDMLSKEAISKLTNYEDAMYRVEGEMATIYDQAYVNVDPATLDHGGIATAFINKTIEATLTSFTDMNKEEAIDFAAGPGKSRTASYMLEKFEEIIPVFNEENKDKIEAGEIDELGFTIKEMEAIEKSFGEEVGEGVGNFVPMLIELGVLSAATGTVMSIPTIARSLSVMRGGSGFQKATYHLIMATIEEGKMHTVDMGMTTGSSFYIGGQLSANMTPFKSRFKWMDPLYQKVIKGGVVGAASSQLAIVSESAYDDLMGNANFQGAMDDHFGDLEFKDIITEAIVFGIVGASHVKKTDLMRTKAKFDAVAELTNEMNKLMPMEGREKMSEADRSKYDSYSEAKSKLEQMSIDRVVVPKVRI